MSHHAFFRRERACPLQPPVGASSFDAEASISRAHVSPSSPSRMQVSPVASLEAQPIHVDAPSTDVVVPEVFGGDFYYMQTMLLGTCGTESVVML
ncbi:unnamed protein product [Lathyrus oleraceus]